MQRYLATMCYEHENYVNDIERKKQYKKDIVSAMYRPPKVRPKNLTIGGRYFYG